MMKFKNWKRTTPNEYFNKRDNLIVEIRENYNGYYAVIINKNTNRIETLIPYKTKQSRKKVIKLVERYLRKN